MRWRIPALFQESAAPLAFFATSLGEMMASMAEPNTTRDLAQRAASGDRQAFEGLVDLYSPRIAALARARLGKQALQQTDAADVVQETFAKAFQHIERLSWHGESAFFGWLASIAENVVLRVVQKAKRAPLQLERDVPGSGASPSKSFRREERWDRLQEPLNALPPDHREVIVLARIEKLEMKEIALRMNRSPNAVKKLLARALDELKKRFGDTESLHLPDRRLDTKGGGS